MQNSHRIQHIDAWRFVAIAMVVASHVVVFSHPWYREYTPFLFWRLRHVGAFGVQIFFCISGFVICRGLLQERERGFSINIKGFYIRRLFRIAPPLLVYLLGVALFAAAGAVDVSGVQILRSGLFLCNVEALGGCGWSLGHTWSLAYEEQFYLFFPLLLLGAGLSINATKRRLLLVAIAFMAVALIALQLAYNGVATYLSVFYYLLCGCVFAAYWNILEVLLKRVRPLLWGMVAAVTLSVGCFFPIPDHLRHILDASVMPLAICITVFGTPVSVPVIRTIFLNGWICHLGKISFTLYLWQQLATADYSLASPMWTLLMIMAVLALALMSYRYFELPLVRIGARFSASAAPDVLSLQDKPRHPDAATSMTR